MSSLQQFYSLSIQNTIMLSSVDGQPEEICQSVSFPISAPPSIDSSPKRPTTESLEKSANASQFRQTMQMKRYRHQRLAFESKPVGVHGFQQQYFAVEPVQSEMLASSLPGEEPRGRGLSGVLPMTSSNWVANTKRTQAKWLLGRKEEQRQRTGSFKRSVEQGETMRDLREYFSSMKQYLVLITHMQSNHKRKVERERKSRVLLSKTQGKKPLEEGDNLSIIRLKPSIDPKARTNPRQSSAPKEEGDTAPISPRLQEHSSANHIKQPRSLPREASLSLKSQTAEGLRKQKPPSIFKRPSVIRQEEFHFIFGRLKDTLNDEQLQKLRVLYYRDFIWKVWFNRGFTYQPTMEVFRYFVGRGNNSRLIRRIMGRRPWWVQDSKIENADFVWTQLKVYDAYKAQRSVSSQQCLLITNVELPEGQLPMEGKRQRDYLKGDRNGFILSKSNYNKWRAYITSRGGVQNKPKESMTQRRLAPKLQTKKEVPPRMTNHLEFSRVIGNKKALYRTMETYYRWRGCEGNLPLTFHITGGLQDEEYFRFLREFYRKSKEGSTCWIVKPGELSNRGRDIQYCRSLQEVKDCIRQRKTNTNGSARTYVLQSYLEKPFLYNGRKFDLRHYLLLTSTEGRLRGYFYQQGYVRTTSYPFALGSTQPAVHLTNDAVQKTLPHYGKYQRANKLSYQQLDAYMLALDPSKGFYSAIFPQLRQIGSDIIRAAFPFVDPLRRANNFEIFGIDVMVDSDCRCWLIQVNTNPCIEVNCAVLAAVIPPMLENAFGLALDPNFLPAQGSPKGLPDNYLSNNKFELVFDEVSDGAVMLNGYKELSLDIGTYGDDDDNFESCDEEDYE